MGDKVLETVTNRNDLNRKLINIIVTDNVTSYIIKLNLMLDNNKYCSLSTNYVVSGMYSREYYPVRNLSNVTKSGTGFYTFISSLHIIIHCFA